MEKYVEEGLLNPRVEPTQSSFNRLFAAWLIEHNWYVLHTVYYFPAADLVLTTLNRGIRVYQHTLQIHSMSIFPPIRHSCAQDSGTDLC